MFKKYFKWLKGGKTPKLDIKDIDNWDTSKVTNFKDIFPKGMESIDKLLKPETTFKVDFGDGIKIYTYTELNEKFESLSEPEKTDLYKKELQGCTTLNEMPKDLFYTDKVVTLSEMFKNCKTQDDN